MLKEFTVARVYAKAIFEIASEYNTVNQWKEFLNLFSKISQNTLIKSLCFSALNVKKLSTILIALFEDYNQKKIDFFNCNFIYIIVKNNRVLLLPEILEEFNKFHNNYIKSLTIEVISAYKLSENQLKKINEIMTHRLSRKIQIICHINKKILSGIIIKIGDTIIDGSLKRRLSRLHNFLQF